MIRNIQAHLNQNKINRVCIISKKDFKYLNLKIVE